MMYNLHLQALVEYRNNLNDKVKIECVRFSINITNKEILDSILMLKALKFIQYWKLPITERSNLNRS